MNPTNYEVFVYGFYFALGGAACGILIAMAGGLLSAAINHCRKGEDE